jgi:hypothetical protein
MIKKLPLFIICISFLSNSFAKVDYIRVMFNHNGSNQATVGWDQISGDNPVIYFGTKDNNPADYKKYTLNQKPSTSNTFKGMNNNFARLESLLPNTAYYFVIVDSEGQSERFWFMTTPNDSAEKISLIGGGDSRTRRIQRQMGFLMAGKLMPHAILFDGDYTDIDTEGKWRLWFEDWKYTYKDFDNRVIPVIAARGNHEQSNKVIVNFFDCPAKNNAYSVTLGGDLINVISLNTEISVASQRGFLKRTLEQHKNYYWQLPQYHRACRPHIKWKLKHRIPKLIYKYWIPLLEKYGVRAVLECDSHLTKTTYPIKKSKNKKDGGFNRDDENGIIYVGEGCWGAPLRTPDVRWTWTKSAGKVDSFKWFTIDQNKMEIRTVAYMNADSIEAVTNENRFDLPNGINLWPNNKEVVEIYKKVNCVEVK